MLAVHGDRCTYSVPGLPRARSSTALAQTVVQAVESHFLHSQRTLRNPQTLAIYFYTSLGQVGGGGIKKDLKWLTHIKELEPKLY